MEKYSWLCKFKKEPYDYLPRIFRSPDSKNYYCGKRENEAALQKCGNARMKIVLIFVTVAFFATISVYRMNDIVITILFAVMLVFVGGLSYLIESCAEENMKVMPARKYKRMVNVTQKSLTRIIMFCSDVNNGYFKRLKKNAEDLKCKLKNHPDSVVVTDLFEEKLTKFEQSLEKADEYFKYNDPNNKDQRDVILSIINTAEEFEDVIRRMETEYDEQHDDIVIIENKIQNLKNIISRQNSKFRSIFAKEFVMYVRDKTDAEVKALKKTAMTKLLSCKEKLMEDYSMTHDTCAAIDLLVNAIKSKQSFIISDYAEDILKEYEIMIAMTKKTNDESAKSYFTEKASTYGRELFKICKYEIEHFDDESRTNQRHAYMMEKEFKNI